MDDMASSDYINGSPTRINGSQYFAGFEGNIDDYVMDVESINYKEYQLEIDGGTMEPEPQEDPDQIALQRRQAILNEYRGVISEIAAAMSGMNGSTYLDRYDDNAILETSEKMDSAKFKEQLINRINFLNPITENS